MADKSPLKATYNGSDTNGLAEFASDDTVAIADGGTGATTASGARTALGVSPTAGSSSLTTLGTVATGTWEATDVAVAHGGTGASTASEARTNLGITDTTPGGSNTEIQYNNSGSFGASANLTFDGSTLLVGTSIAATADTNTSIGLPGSDVLTFSTGGTEALRINNEGVLGIKTTPASGWHTDHGVLQIGTGALWVDPHDESAASNMVFLSNNLYRDHADEWRAIVTDEITRYYQYNGEHYFDTSNVTTAGAAMSGNSNKLKIANDGAVTIPLQPSFNASVSYNSQSNVTGDATNHTIVFDTEVFDRGADYNTSTGVFTAPVTGLYQLNVSVQWMGVTSGMNDCSIGVATSNGGYTVWQDSASGISPNMTHNGTMLEDMDAGDTAHVTIDFRNGSKVVDVWTASQFSGALTA